MKKQGFTLIELLVAGSIAATLTAVAVGVYINTSRSYRRIHFENYLYTESNILLGKLEREIQKGTIDYEEYHNQIVLLGKDRLGNTGVYGENYGEYAKKFYHPGVIDSQNTEDPKFGMICANDNTKRYDSNCNEDTDPSCSATCSPYIPSQDYNTGRNPYVNADTSRTSDDATALCDNFFNGALDNVTPLNRVCDFSLDADGNPVSGDGTPSEPEDFAILHFQKELYLINSVGDEKTLMARERINDGHNTIPGDADDEYGLSLLRLEGIDENQDDMYETWQCVSNFVCTGTSTSAAGTVISKPNPLDLSKTISHKCATPPCSKEIIGSEDFVAITPSNINITSLKFLISPLEDPYKAYAEDDTLGDYILKQPEVTIVITVRPSFKEAYKFYGSFDKFPEITLQTKVTSLVYGEVKSL